MLELSNAARECVLAPLEKSVQIATIHRSQKGPVASVDVELASELDIELHGEPDIQPGVQLGMECPGAMPAMLATPAASPDNELVTAPGRVFGFLERHSLRRRIVPAFKRASVCVHALSACTLTQDIRQEGLDSPGTSG